MSSRIAQCTLDVVDVERMAEFWSAVLGYRAERDEGDSIHLAPPSGDGPSMWLQPTDERKLGKLRCHMDLEADDPIAEVERVLALGARSAPAERAFTPRRGSDHSSPVRFGTSGSDP